MCLFPCRCWEINVNMVHWWIIRTPILLVILVMYTQGHSHTQDRLTQGKWQDVSELITLYSKYETTADGREEKHHSTVSLKVCLWVVFLCDVSHHFLSLPPHSSSSGSVACLLSKCRKHACTSITCNTVLFRLFNHDRFHGWLMEASFNKALNYWKTDDWMCVLNLHIILPVTLWVRNYVFLSLQVNFIIFIRIIHILVSKLKANQMRYMDYKIRWDTWTWLWC